MAGEVLYSRIPRELKAAVEQHAAAFPTQAAAVADLLTRGLMATRREKDRERWHAELRAAERGPADELAAACMAYDVGDLESASALALLACAKVAVDEQPASPPRPRNCGARPECAQDCQLILRGLPACTW